MMAQRGNRGIAIFLLLPQHWKGVGGPIPCPSCFTPRKETWYPLYRRLGGPHGQSGWVQKISPPTGIWSPDHPACSKLLDQLHYPGPWSILVPFLNLKPSKKIPKIHTKQQKFAPHYSTSHRFFRKWISGGAPVLLLRAEFKFICNGANTWIMV